MSAFLPSEAERKAQQEDYAARLQAQAQSQVTVNNARAEQGRLDREHELELQGKQREASREERRKTAAVISRNAAHIALIIAAFAALVMAWKGMTVFGIWLYGPYVGPLLPVLTEAASISFALATSWRLAHDPGRPVWHWRLGTLVFWLAGGAMNFLSGLQPGAVLHPGFTTATVHAVIAMSPVAIHQLLTAGPRATARERTGHMAARVGERTRRAMCLWVMRHAAGLVSHDGNVELAHQRGTIVQSGRRMTYLSEEEAARYAALPPGPAPEAPAGPAERPDWNGDGGGPEIKVPEQGTLRGHSGPNGHRQPDDQPGEQLAKLHAQRQALPGRQPDSSPRTALPVPGEPAASRSAPPRPAARSKRPPQEVIDAAREYLRALPPDAERPSARSLAANHLHDPGQRRLAAGLLKELDPLPG